MNDQNVRKLGTDSTQEQPVKETDVPTPSTSPSPRMDPPPAKERDMLAAAIRDAAVACGLAREDVSLTGPDLLMLCDNLRELAQQSAQDRATESAEGRPEAEIERLTTFIQSWEAKPLRGLGGPLHSIHVGTEWEAHLSIPDLRELVAYVARAEAVAALNAPVPTDTSADVAGTSPHLEAVVRAVVADMEQWGADAGGAHIDRVLGELRSAVQSPADRRPEPPTGTGGNASETLLAAAKRLRLGVEGPRLADELEAMAEREALPPRSGM